MERSLAVDRVVRANAEAPWSGSPTPFVEARHGSQGHDIRAVGKAREHAVTGAPPGRFVCLMSGCKIEKVGAHSALSFGGYPLGRREREVVARLVHPP